MMGSEEERGAQNYYKENLENTGDKWRGGGKRIILERLNLNNNNKSIITLGDTNMRKNVKIKMLK